TACVHSTGRRRTWNARPTPLAAKSRRRNIAGRGGRFAAKSKTWNSKPRSAVSRPDSGGQHRPDESRRQILIPPGLQVFHVRHVVDSAGDYACDCGSGAYDSYPSAHDRNHQQADPHVAATGAGTGTRAYVGRDRQAHGHSSGESAQGAEDRAGTDLARNADRRRGRFASGRLHRRPRRGFSGRGGHQREPEGPDRTGPAHADSARRKSYQDALRPRRRQRAHAGRSRAVIRGDPRAYSPDRSQGAAQAAASLALAEVARVYGWGAGLARNMWGRPPSAVRFSPRRHGDTEKDRNNEWGTASAAFFAKSQIETRQQIIQ